MKVFSLDPFPRKEFDLKKLKGFEDFYRVRIGGYRLIYHVSTDQKKVRF